MIFLKRKKIKPLGGVGGRRVITSLIIVTTLQKALLLILSIKNKE
jgi:hypothetical protein